MKDVVITIPCFNEEKTVGKVIDDAKAIIPEARILVYNNNSSDKTAEIAEKHGAEVILSPMQGKGYVVQQMFSEFTGDILLMVDGDNTYPMKYAVELVSAIEEGADMAIGDRLSGTYRDTNQRAFHNFGNNLVRFLVNKRYKANIPDIMTGFRAFSKECVKNMDLHYGGFETETEMTIKAIKNKLKISSIPIEYKEREAGSISKLNTVRDGIKVLRAIYSL